ncbi:hypothetical protein [Mesoterricola silvestris]|uniref:Uncharacterized protein n=1 Tax=Mesoterricola silvestris TaxID=2927979 RepID=A0AA48KAF1_9BACT|nr:hypothetical protein [Mesoterricola silvestris]BDU73252.1 hypothetical protein METEAL_24260 [Mesoterricola silvestris]
MTPHPKKPVYTPWIVAALLAAAPATAMADAVDYLRTSVAPRYQLELNETTFAQNNIKKGRVILKQILDDQYDYLASDEAYGTYVVAVMWALFDAGVAKGQGYEQGSFVVEDKDWRLFEFLRGNQGSFARHSSHLKKATQLTHAGHYGIDILGSYQAGSADWTPYSSLNPTFVQQNILPARKGTVLFIPMAAGTKVGLETNQLFIKMEDHGIQTWYGFANHAWDFVTGTCLGMNDPHETARKERIDKQLVKRYQAMISTAPNAQFTADTSIAQELGVRAMVREANRLNGALGANPGFRRAHADFTAALDAKGYDHLAMRTGDEVIFTQAELRLAIGGPSAEIRNPAVPDTWVTDMAEADDWEPEPAAARAQEPAPAKAKGFLGTVSSWIW